MRALIVVRHAKAEPDAATDHARRLTDRGRRDATERGRQLAAYVTGRATALVSSATRTRETFAALDESLGIADDHVVVTDALYDASAREVLEQLRMVDDDAQVVVVVGHNPAMSDLVWMLHDGTHNAAWRTYSDRGFPTSAAAVLTYDGEWADADPRGLRLEDYLAP